MTHNEVVYLLESIANNHYQINGFGFGDAWEYLSTSTPQTPCLWGILNGSTRNDKEINLNYTLLVFDQVKRGEENENNVLSDCHRILLGVLSILNSPTYQTQFILGKSSNLQDFTERFDNVVTGWSCDITIRIPFDNNPCAEPSSGLPSLANNYDVTIYDQNGNIVILIPPGGSYEVVVASGIKDLGSGYTNNVIDI